jgi:hypothetical protein
MMNSDTLSSSSSHSQMDVKNPQLDKLRSMLNLGTPGSPEETPPVFTFQRQRDVEINWKEVCEGVEGKDSTGSIKAIREYFETGWWGTSKTSETLLLKQVYSEKIPPDKQKDWGIQELKPGQLEVWTGPSAKPESEKLDKGVLLRHKASGRMYHVIEVEGSTLPITDFGDEKTYNTAWISKIAGVEMVFESKDAAEKFCVQFSEIDLRPSIIARRYNELKVMLGLAKSVSNALPPIDADKLKALIDAGTDVDEIARLQQKYARIMKNVADVEREIERLASIAENMGLILCTEKRDIKTPDGKTIIRTLQEGEICLPYQHKVTWTTTHTRQQLRWAFFFFYHKPVTFTRQHVEVITDYEPVNTSVDLLIRWREDHMKNFPQDEVIVLQQAGKRFVAADGSPLRAIMDRCDLDESFRRRCVVLLPIFEESLTGERVLAKYHVFKHPLPGITPAIMPRLALEESLSYRTVWDGIVLGELANTINLAPGEQRTIHVRKAYKRETTVSRTAVSIFDVNRAESSDLATEMERIARQERERSSNLQTETSASGGAFGVTASASVKAGVTTSAKEFGQSMARVAKNAATSVTQQNREEVTTSSTLQTTVETTEETTAEIRNINEGRTLNLMFYRLYNRYKGGLYIEGLQFNLIPSVETIAGSGVFEAETYSAAELDKVLDKLQQNPLMLDLDPEAELRLRETVLTELYKLITKEYGDQDEAADKRVPGTQADQKMLLSAAQPKLSVNVLQIKSLDAAVTLSTGFESAESQPERNFKESKKSVKDIQEQLDTVLRTSIAALKTKQQIEPVNLMVGSGGLYLDASVGALPSTEPYSEEMRKREIRMRDAEIFATRSKGVLQQAQASQITGSNFLTSIHPDRENLNRLTLGLNTFIEPGDWQLQVDREVKGKVSADQAVNMIRFTWKGKQEWLKMPDLKQHVELYNPESSRVIRFPVITSAEEVE